MDDKDFIDKDDIVSVTPVRLDVLKIAFGKRKLCQCFEPSYEVDTQNRLVWCRDCSAIVDPFEALKQIAWQHERINRAHERMMDERESVVGYEPRLKVMKELSKRYTGKNSPMVPRCPHCGDAFEIHDLLSTSWCSRCFLKTKEYPKP